MTEKQYLIDFYNQYDEDSRLALKHGSVEFLTTMRYIEKYRKPGDRLWPVRVVPWTRWSWSAIT